jgi:hypothetical protein
MVKLMDGVSKKVRALVGDLETGDWCDSRRSLIKAYALGLLDADGDRHAIAVRHLRDCPACRRRVLVMRGLTAVAPPAPAILAMLRAGPDSAEAPVDLLRAPAQDGVVTHAGDAVQALAGRFADVAVAGVVVVASAGSMYAIGDAWHGAGSSPREPSATTGRLEAPYPDRGGRSKSTERRTPTVTRRQKPRRKPDPPTAPPAVSTPTATPVATATPTATTPAQVAATPQPAATVTPRGAQQPAVRDGWGEFELGQAGDP